MRRVFEVGAALGAAALLFSFLSPISPLADSVAHFRLHLLAVLAAGAAVLAAVRARWPAAALLLLVLLSAMAGLRPAWPGGPTDRGIAPQVTLLQLNLLYKNADHDAVLALIEAERPDLITLQEVSEANRPLLAALRAQYPQQAVCRFAAVGAVAVLSRFPRARGGDERQLQGCVAGRGFGWLRVATPQGPLSVATLHLHWPYPYGQKQQIDRLGPALTSTPRPVLLGGDFNAAPWSHAASRIARALDAPALGGLRFTFHRRFAPLTPEIGLPIDHVLADASLAAVDVRASEPVGSDHRAVIARLVWRSPADAATTSPQGR